MAETRGQRKRQLEREHDIEWEIEQKRKSLSPDQMECWVNLGDRIEAGTRTNDDGMSNRSGEEDTTENSSHTNQVNSNSVSTSTSTSVATTSNDISNMTTSITTSAIDKDSNTLSTAIPSTQISQIELSHIETEKVEPAVIEPTEAELLVAAMALRGEPVEHRMMASNKNNAKILYSVNEKQRYKRNKENKKKNYWAMTCCVQKCPARVYKYGDGRCVYAKNFCGHNHTTTFEEVVKEHQFKQELKDDCGKLDMVGGKLVPVREIFAKKSDESNVSVSFKSVESLCNQARRNALPKNAANIQEILDAFKKDYVRSTYGSTYRPNGSKTSTFFKHAQDNGDGTAFCLFSSDEIVKLIEANVPVSERKLYSDATFKITPVGCFKQVLVMHCNLMGNVVPFATACMTGKSEKEYIAVLHYIDQNIMTLNCASIMTDYEKALRNAFTKIAPLAKMTTCWFHFCQACKRYAHKLGMKTMLEKNQNGRNAYYELLALPLLPAEQIVNAFETIETRVNAQKVPNFKRFLTYYRNQWLTREGPSNISVFDLYDRSTGAVEAYNGVMGKCIPTHGSFFRFVLALRYQEWLKAKQVRSYVKSGGSTGPIRKGKSKIKSAQISAATEALKTGRINAAQFMKWVTFGESKVCNNFLNIENVSPIDDDVNDIHDNDEADENEAIRENIHDDVATGSEINPDGKCIACLVEDPQMVIVPCGHCVFCMGCWKEWNEIDKSKFNQPSLEDLIYEEDIEDLDFETWLDPVDSNDVVMVPDEPLPPPPLGELTTSQIEEVLTPTFVDLTASEINDAIEMEPNEPTTSANTSKSVPTKCPMCMVVVQQAVKLYLPN